MDQSSYLSRTLWEYQSSSNYTDLTLVCADASLLAHAVMLAPLFTSFGISFPSREEVPECLFLPDLTTVEVKQALKALYLQSNLNHFLALVKKTPALVKIELLDYVESSEPKVILDEFKETKQDLLDDLDVPVDYTDEDNKEWAPDIAEVKKEKKKLKTRKHKSITPSKINQKVFECKKCGDECHGKNEYICHMKEYHGFKPKFVSKKGLGDTSKCPYCEKELKNGNYDSHLSRMHREETIKNHPEIKMILPCPRCDLMFHNTLDLDKHSMTLHGKSTREWKCKVCDLEFDRYHTLTKHRKENHIEDCIADGLQGVKKDKQCQYCESMFKLDRTRHIHMFNVHKDKRHLHPEIKARFFCELCDEGFFDGGSLGTHTKSKHTQNSVCPICQKVCTSLLALESHTRQHHSNENHVCDVCSKEFPTKVGLKTHMKRHSGGKVYKFRCSQCAKGKYQSEEKLQQHILNDHSGLEYICVHCPMTFKSNDARHIHERRNHSEKTIKCDHCDMMFALMSAKTAHVKMVHLGKKVTLCPLCGEGFTDKCTFEAHVNRHTNNRQFACETCGKAFLIQRDLVNHIKTHTRPYHCDQCEESFGSTMVMKDHIRRVHECIQIECRYGCGWQSWDRRNMHRHEVSCKCNPVPNAPYTVASGTAKRDVLHKFHAKLLKKK